MEELNRLALILGALPRTWSDFLHITRKTRLGALGGAPPNAPLLPTTVFVQIADTLPPAVCQALDELLTVTPDDSRSPLLRLKEYPPAASAAVLLTYISRYHLARDVVAGQIDLSRHPAQLVQQLVRVAKRYDVQAGPAGAS